jgi:hypothetical protein
MNFGVSNDFSSHSLTARRACLLEGVRLNGGGDRDKDMASFIICLSVRPLGEK